MKNTGTDTIGERNGTTNTKLGMKTHHVLQRPSDRFSRCRYLQVRNEGNFKIDRKIWHVMDQCHNVCVARNVSVSKDHPTSDLFMYTVESGPEHGVPLVFVHGWFAFCLSLEKIIRTQSTTSFSQARFSRNLGQSATHICRRRISLLCC